MIGRMALQIFAGRDEGKNFLLIAKFAREEVEELRPFIPPMPKQLRVVGRDDDGRSVEQAVELPDLREAFVKKMLCVGAGGV